MKAFDFCLPDENGKEVCLEKFKGKWIVLYFYPKDNTSGCTKEAVNFSKNIKKFEEMGAYIIGISPDSTSSHKKFKEKHDLKIKLLSDEKKEVIKKYGVWRLKKMYGREYHGVERSTFLISPDGEIIYEWRKVRVNGHVEKVLEKLKEVIK
ncbi:MAG TPA: peroxiredoxin [Thermoplasmatales archaeon]|nr:peroxiredoxin [Thermoplasmatales archaeon]